MTLYLKYRPKDIDELDLEGVRESLTNIVKSKKIPHAFLFAGPKGTGKTSAARILAKIVNCEKRRKNSAKPCNKCGQCKSIENGNNIDVIELDAASHRGIDDIRSLREAVKLAPSRAQKKVYIIDEAHMLTTEASNALLKTLEEPPGHVMFILATTNPEKLIPTIRSRTTAINFKNASKAEVMRCLERVAKGEKVKADPEALEKVAKASGGSFRDAIKIVEQLLSQNKEIKKDVVEEYIFGGALAAEDIIPHLVRKDAKSALQVVEKLTKSGQGIELYIDNLIEKLRQALLAKVGVGEGDIKDLTKDEIISLITKIGRTRVELRGSTIEQLPFEIAIIDWCEEVQGVNSNEQNMKEDKKPLGQKEKSMESKRKKVSNPAWKSKNLDDGIWSRIVTTVRSINTPVEALLRASRPIDFDGERLTIGVFYRFHKERLEQVQNKRFLEGIIEDILGRSVKVVCTLSEPPKKKVEEAKEEVVLTEGKDEDIIKVAEEIFS